MDVSRGQTAEGRNVFKEHSPLNTPGSAGGQWQVTTGSWFWRAETLIVSQVRTSTHTIDVGVDWGSEMRCSHSQSIDTQTLVNQRSCPSSATGSKQLKREEGGRGEGGMEGGTEGGKPHRVHGAHTMCNGAWRTHNVQWGMAHTQCAMGQEGCSHNCYGKWGNHGV